MLKAILRFKNGIEEITWVDSTPSGNGGHFIRNFVAVDNIVFKLIDTLAGKPVYEELDVRISDFYGYEEEET